MGLIVFGAVAAYAIVLAAATWFAYRWAAIRNLPRSRRAVAAAVGFLLIYLPVFWDHIPTLVTHKYYCKTEAGFWVYKTADQWNVENPGVLETLVAANNEPILRAGDMQNYTDTHLVNQRFNLLVTQAGPLPVNLWRHESKLLDRASNTVLARYVDFSTSQERRQAGLSGWKFWLDNKHCDDGRDRLIAFGSHVVQFKGSAK